MFNYRMETLCVSIRSYFMLESLDGQFILSSSHVQTLNYHIIIIQHDLVFRVYRPATYVNNIHIVTIS